MRVRAFCSALVWAVFASAQTPQSANFDELAGQATAALKDNPGAAIGLYRQALALRPDWAEGWFYLAAAQYETSRFPESKQAFEKAAALAPDNGTVWAFLGLSEYQMKSYPQALSDIRKGERLGMGDNKQFVSKTRNTGAIICLRSGEFGQAMEQLQPLATIGDDSTPTIEAFGVTALAFPRAPGEVPPDKRTLIQLAGRAAWAMAAQRAAEANSSLHQLVTQYPNEAGVHYLYGIYLLAGDPEAAGNEFRKELQIRPEHIPARIQLANLELKAGDADKAAQLAREAIKLQPANIYGHLMLGRALLNMAEFDKSIAELESAARLAPQQSEPHFYLEQAYRRAGKSDEAQKEHALFARLKSVQDPLFRPDYGGVPEGAANAPVQ